MGLIKFISRVFGYCLVYIVLEVLVDYFVSNVWGEFFRGIKNR